MKKIILLLAIVLTTTITTLAEPVNVHKETHEVIDFEDDFGINRNPLQLPITILYYPDQNVLEVWCDDDNIYGKVFVYDESGRQEAYSPYMNVSLPLSSTGNHSIIIKGDGWEAVGEF